MIHNQDTQEVFSTFRDQQKVRLHHVTVAVVGHSIHREATKQNHFKINV